AHDIGTVDAHREEHEAPNHPPQEAQEPDVQGLLGWHGHLTSRRAATAVCWRRHADEHAEPHRRAPIPSLVRRHAHRVTRCHRACPGTHNRDRRACPSVSTHSVTSGWRTPVGTSYWAIWSSTSPRISAHGQCRKL